MPTKAGLGTDMLALHPETTREQIDAATGEPLRRLHAAPGRRRDRARARPPTTRGNVRVDPKLVWMDSELVKAAATTIVDRRAHRPRGELPRRARTARRIRGSPSRPSSRRPGARTRPRASRATRYDGDFFRAYAAAHTDPRRRPGLLGRADRRAGDACRVPGRERRPAHAPLDRPEDDVSAEYTIDELMVTTLARRVHERHARLQRRRLVRPRLRLPARPAHARARSRLGRELDRDRRRPEVDSRSRRSRTASGTAPACSPTRPTTSGPTRRTAATTRSPSAAPRWTRYGNVNNTDDRAVRVAEGAPAGRRRDGGPELHDPAHLPLVDDPRRTDVRGEARLPLRESAGATAATIASGSGSRAGLSSASRTSASSPSIRTRSGCRSAASTPASAPSR